MNLPLTTTNRTDVFESVKKYLADHHLRAVSQDDTRPWGGFFVIDEQQAIEFGKLFFPNVGIDGLRISGKLSPKILLVEPQKRLSWQYHHRRAEIWRVVAGTVAVATSMNDEEQERTILKVNDTIRLSQGQRHRLIGLDNWGVVAEIWQHTDVNRPSNEEDIIRLQDDFGR